MLQTPIDFIPLINPQDHARRRTIVCHGQRLLLREGDFALPPTELVDELGLSGEQIHPIGLWQEEFWQVAWTGSDTVPPGYSYTGLRALFGIVDDSFLGLLARAAQLAEWARTHRHCGVCATPMVRAAGERAFKCPSCGHFAYPRISPAMMVLIRKGDSVLLAQHTQSPYKRYTALAGFLEAGESIEEAVHREVAEEVGLKVHNLQYFGSQSWPFPHSLMVAFTADYLSGDIRIDPSEIADARWFGPDDEWPEMPIRVSIAAALVNAHRPAGK